MDISAQIASNLKKEFLSETGVELDFRAHVFLDNQYGNSPCFDYNFAEKVITFVYKYMSNYLEENQDKYLGFGGWEYNLNMSIENLRTTKLKVFIDEKINEMQVYKKPA